VPRQASSRDEEKLSATIGKRAFDIALSSLGLLLLLPLFGLIALVIKLDSKGPVFFRQERVGLGGRSFWIYKFRTMVADAPLKGGQLTAPKDSRITPVGQTLRRIKADELPQLINVLKGEMTLVGPRPEVRRYVDLFRQDYEEILSVRPGITDLASLKYRDESAELSRAADPELEYVTRVLPDKIALAKEYVRRSSFSFDLALIARTIVKIVVH
jgi:lipopolysaccharide/colanic/teichoic acid biosynthesis glycosyltransferase